MWVCRKAFSRSWQVFQRASEAPIAIGVVPAMPAVSRLNLIYYYPARLHY